MANLYLLKCMDSFDSTMMAGQNMRRLSSMCRHDNRLLRDTVAKFWRILPVFDGKGLGYLGPMPDCWFQRENNCESCRKR